MDHFWTLSRLQGTLIAIWSNLTERVKIAQRRHKYDSNLSYLDTITNIGTLYATLNQIKPIMCQSALYAITWYTRPRFINSALKWTNSFKFDILHHSGPPLPTTDHTGSLDAILCSICLQLASEDTRRQLRLNSSKLNTMSYTMSKAINGHSSL